MAITDSDYLHIHKGDSSFILLRNSTHFHLIRIDADLSKSRMDRLLRIYPCDANQLHKLGVHFSAFKASNLRGIVITGYQAGDTLELWLGGDIREYQLGSDYSDDVLAHFFKDHLITRRLPPKWEGLAPSIIRKITWSTNGISIACAIAFYFISTPYRLWSILCIMCQLSALVLTLLYPASFTLADDSKKHKLYINKGKGHLLPACVAPGFALCLRTLTDFTFTDRTFEILLLVSLVTSLVLCAVYILINKGLRNGLVNAIAVIFAIVFLGLGTVGQLNYLLDFGHVDRQIVEVVDKQITRQTKSTNYDCTVQLPNGGFMELTLSARKYKDIDIGDDVIVVHYGGAFRIPFSTVETLSDTYEMG